MKKQWGILCILVILVSISIWAERSDNQETIYQEELKSVKQVGKLPDEFKEIIEKNVFQGITAFDERLLKVEVCSANEENKTVVQQVRMMDLYGNDLATYERASDDAYHVHTLTATEDGGFLFVLGFRDYAYNQFEMASDNGFASHIIKCDSQGNLEFDTTIDNVEGNALTYCFEQDEHFYFFGERETPDTKKRGVHSSTDIYMAILDKNGNVNKFQMISGSDFDDLDAAEISENAFLLSICSQSDDGDFTGSNSGGYGVHWVFTINNRLEIVKKEIKSGRDYFDKRIGVKDSAPVYQSNRLFNSFDAGTTNAFIDYGDFYLIVSENRKGKYEYKLDAGSFDWYYTETVYSAYKNNGKLIFRASVDSTPDYEARFKYDIRDGKIKIGESSGNIIREYLY